MIDLYKTMRLQTAKPTREARIYGVEYDYTQKNIVWRRTDAAVGKTVAISVGNVAGHSDFDNCYPWSAMKRVTLPTGDVMVKIPSFYYQRTRDGNIERIRIADRPTEGFEKHPGSGCYVSAYLIDEDYMSKRESDPIDSANFSDKDSARIQAKGDGWNLIGYKEHSALVFLTIVEFASHNVSEIFPLPGGGEIEPSGYADDVPHLTGMTEDQKVSVYRGMEQWLCYNGCHVKLKVWDMTATLDGMAIRIESSIPGADIWDGRVKKISYIAGHTWAMLPTDIADDEDGSLNPPYFSKVTLVSMHNDTVVMGGGSDSTGMFGTNNSLMSFTRSIYRPKEA